MINWIDQLSKLFIRPPRMNYPLDLLGPDEIEVCGNLYGRQDLQIQNSRNLPLECSYFRPRGSTNQRLPCIVYLHGNCGSRLDALEIINMVGAYRISLFCFDFSGSGLSGGEYISLGYYETEDVISVIDWLKKSETTSKIALWGRSMGASTSLITASILRDEISCMILDSPFESLSRVAHEYFENNKINAPKFLVSTGLEIVRRNVLGKANFDLTKVEPLAIAPKCKMPALFLHAFSDILVAPHHSHHIAEQYGGEARLVNFTGDHNSLRTAQAFDQVTSFIYTELIRCDPSILTDSVIPVFPLCRGSNTCFRFFYCRINEDNLVVPRSESSVVLLLGDSGLFFYKPFTKEMIREFPVSIIRGFCYDDESFLFKYAEEDEEEKIIFLYTIEGPEIAKTIEGLKEVWEYSLPQEIEL